MSDEYYKFMLKINKLACLILLSLKRIENKLKVVWFKFIIEIVRWIKLWISFYCSKMSCQNKYRRWTRL